MVDIDNVSQHSFEPPMTCMHDIARYRVTYTGSAVTVLYSFAMSFRYRAGLSKGSEPLVIADKIEVVELEVDGYIVSRTKV